MDATTVAVDLAKDVFEVALANRAGRIVGPPTADASAVRALRRHARGRNDGGDGGLRHGARLGSALSGARARRPAAPRAVRPALRPSQQDGSHRYRGHARSPPLRRHPAGPGQDVRAASAAGAASGAHAVAGDADQPRQRAARSAAIPSAEASQTTALRIPTPSNVAIVMGEAAAVNCCRSTTSRCHASGWSGIGAGVLIRAGRG